MATVLALPHRAAGATAPARPARTPDASRLNADDMASLRRAVALAHENLHGFVVSEGGKRPLRIAYALSEELAALHRRLEPRRYGREAGTRP